jgi:hypothetical protein
VQFPPEAFPMNMNYSDEVLDDIERTYMYFECIITNLTANGAQYRGNTEIDNVLHNAIDNLSQFNISLRDDVYYYATSSIGLALHFRRSVKERKKLTKDLLHIIS